jgi:hypothetical protein
MRRRTLLVVLAGLAVVVAAGVIVFWPREDRVTRATPPSRITRENFDRICEGMSRAEVETILGPIGDYRTGHGDTDYENIGWTPDPPTNLAGTQANWCRVPGQSPEDARQFGGWISDSFAISIAIDETGHVVGKSGSPRRMTQGPVDSLLWRAKRERHRWFP